MAKITAEIKIINEETHQMIFDIQDCDSDDYRILVAGLINDFAEEEDLELTEAYEQLMVTVSALNHNKIQEDD